MALVLYTTKYVFSLKSNELNIVYTSFNRMIERLMFNELMSPRLDVTLETLLLSRAVGSVCLCP